MEAAILVSDTEVFNYIKQHLEKPLNLNFVQIQHGTKVEQVKNLLNKVKLFIILEDLADDYINSVIQFTKKYYPQMKILNFITAKTEQCIFFKNKVLLTNLQEMQEIILHELS